MGGEEEGKRERERERERERGGPQGMLKTNRKKVLGPDEGSS